MACCLGLVAGPCCIKKLFSPNQPTAVATYIFKFIDIIKISRPASTAQLPGAGVWLNSPRSQPECGQKMLLPHWCEDLVLPGRLLKEKLISPGSLIIWYLFPPPSVLSSCMRLMIGLYVQANKRYNHLCGFSSRSQGELWS